jgi:hypothetical protein
MAESKEMDRYEAERFIRRYVCSTCWGEFEIENIKGEEMLVNVRCYKGDDCTGSGFVSRKGVEIRRSKNSADYIEASINLGKALNLPNPYKNQTVDDHLKALGF